MNVGKGNGNEVKLGLALGIGDQCLTCIGQWSQYQHNISVNPPGITLIYGPREGFGPEDSRYRKISRRRASARIWRGRSTDLEPPGDYQLSVGVEMRSGWPDLQTQAKKFQEKSDLEKSKSNEGS